MTAGKLNRYVEIHQPVKTKSASGDNKLEYKYFKHAWASIEPSSRSGGSQDRNDKEISVSLFDIEIRYQPGIKTNMRVVDCEGVVYQIQHPPRDEKGTRELLTLVARLVDDVEYSNS